MVDHVVCVVADHPAIVYLAGDLAADTRRRRHLSVVLILVVLVLAASSEEDTMGSQLQSQSSSPR
jgi:hypothetical protein